jgi:hypothetical protein
MTFTNASERTGFVRTAAGKHSRRVSITHGAAGAPYSHWVSMEQLAKEIAKVRFGELDGVIKGAARSLWVTHKSARRLCAVYNRRLHQSRGT